MTLLIYLLCSYGIVFGIQYKLPFQVKSNILERLFSCPYCLGFWTGWLVWGSTWRVYENPILGEKSNILGGLVFSLASSTFCYLMDLITSWLENRLSEGGSDG